MKKSTKKLAVLSILQTQAVPLKLSEILNLLESDYPERTVRRLLSEMIAEEIITKTGNKRSTLYQANKSSINEDPQIAFNDKSTGTLGYINQPLFERNPTTYDEKWLEKYIPNKTFYLNNTIRIQLMNAGDKNKMHLPAGTYAKQIYNRLLIDLSYNSSRLEGNTYSLLDTESLILEGKEAPDKLDEEKIMILNHKEAIAYLINNANRIQMDFNTICTLHFLLSDGLIETKYAGKIRDHGVRISGSVYVPWENPKKIQHQLNLICEKASQIQNPFEQSIFLLIQISYLQAFVDVNKRTARLAANISLIKNNLIPLSFNDISKTDYQAALIAIYELKDINPLIDLYVHSYLRTCKQYAVTLEAVSYDEIRVRYRQERRAMLSHIISKGLIKKEMDNYIKKETKKLIPTNHQNEFTKDIQEDIQEISPQRIAGLGVTSQQLEKWLKKNK